LQDESLAKRYVLMCRDVMFIENRSIPVFARELEQADTPVVRNNIMILLSDLCVRCVPLNMSLDIHDV